MGNEVDERVREHEVSIALMTKAISSIENLLVQQTHSIKEIEKAMKSQELLMEKFTHLDTRISDSVNRIHKRLDNSEIEVISVTKRFETEIKELQATHQLKCDLVYPMAQKGERLHNVMVFVAKTLGGLAITLVFGLLVWAIESGGAK